MDLTEDEKNVLEKGGILSKALQLLIDYGDFYGAGQLLPIKNVYTGSAMDPGAGNSFLERVRDEGLKFRVNVVLGVGSLDPENYREYGLPEEIAQIEKKKTDLYVELGAAKCLALSYYSSAFRVCYGEHVVTNGSSNTLMTNSVFGARSNTEGGVAATLSALTGRTPNFGYHLRENRYGNLRVRVQAALKYDSDWEALGYYIGKCVKGGLEGETAVPVITGTERPTFDQIEGLTEGLGGGPTLVSMMHIVGVTPEAPTEEVAFGGRKPERELIVTDQNLQEVYDEFSFDLEKTDLVVLGTQQSLWELKRTAELLEGKRLKESVDLWVFTQPATKAEAEGSGYLRTIEKSGAKVFCGTRFIFMIIPHSYPDFARKVLPYKYIVTDNVEVAGYSIGIGGFHCCFRPLEEAVEIAVRK